MLIVLIQREMEQKLLLFVLMQKGREQKRVLLLICLKQILMNLRHHLQVAAALVEVVQEKVEVRALLL